MFTIYVIHIISKATLLKSSEEIILNPATFTPLFRAAQMQGSPGFTINTWTE